MQINMDVESLTPLSCRARQARRLISCFGALSKISVQQQRLPFPHLLLDQFAAFAQIDTGPIAMITSPREVITATALDVEVLNRSDETGRNRFVSWSTAAVATQRFHVSGLKFSRQSSVDCRLLRSPLMAERIHGRRENNGVRCVDYGFPADGSRHHLSGLSFRQ